MTREDRDLPAAVTFLSLLSSLQFFFSYFFFALFFIIFKSHFRIEPHFLNK